MALRLIIAFCFLISLNLWAADQSAEDRVRNNEIDKKAKQRIYPGGRDEADLRVQNPLPTPTRKLTPTLDDEKSDPSDD